MNTPIFYLKRWFMPSYLILIFLFFNACSQKESSKTTTEITSEVKHGEEGGYAYEYLESDPMNTRVYKLANGLTVYLSPNKREPRIQTLIAVKAGSKNDPSHATGLAHYLEHMVFKGTSKLGTVSWEQEKVLLDSITNLYETYRATKDPRQRKFIYNEIDKVSNQAARFAVPNEYDKLVGNIGAQGTNAYTWLDQTVYVNDIPSNAIERWAFIESERFSEMVPRLFHTELEAVYEEKNRGLDDDSEKSFEAGFLALFPTHTYGTQTTIGTIEHLKNPSIKEIKKFFDTYYRPNNMAVIMAGDFDPTNTIKIIDKQFGKLKPKDIPKYEPGAIAPMSIAETRTVYGPMPAEVNVYFRLPAQNPKEQMITTMVNTMLSNSGGVGLFDVNLNQKQIVRNAQSGFYPFAEAGIFIVSAAPKEKQDLVVVKDKLFQQLDLLKAGKIPAWLLEAAKLNTKRKIEESLKQNSSRTEYFVNAFINGYGFNEMISFDKYLNEITMNDIVTFAKNNLNNNYVIIYKENAPDPIKLKVDKPNITPVPMNRDTASTFYALAEKLPIAEIKPVFVNFEKDLVRASIHPSVKLYYKENTSDKLGSLSLNIETGTNYDKKISLATRYFDLLGTNKYSAEEFKAEIYKLGLDCNVSVSDKQTYFNVSGVDKNIDKGLALFLQKIKDAKPDSSVLKNLIADIKTERSDAKKSKRNILFSGLVNYAMYGEKNPFNNKLTNEELDKITSDELLAIIKTILEHEHSVLYYGPQSKDAIAKVVSNNYLAKAAKTLPKVNHDNDFKLIANKQKQVLFAEYDMVQAEFVFVAKAGERDDNTIPVRSVYNEYFGGNMSSIVFSELRERKALAYSTFARFSETEPTDGNYMFAYIGSQADKTADAVSSLQEILLNMPQSPTGFANAKEALKKRISTERILDESVLFAALENDKWGRKQQTAEITWNALEKITLPDVVAFQQKYVKPQPYSLLALGKTEKLNFKALNKYGTIKELKMKELFGY